jgi:DNA-binding MarR family transcriptional regulator
VRSQSRRDLLEMVGPLYRHLRQIEEQCAQAAGLSMWQYAILSAASSKEGLSQTAIADQLGYSKNRIVGDLDELAGQGLAERRPGADRRAHSIHVTPAGIALVAVVRASIWQREDELLAHLSSEQREVLHGLLRSVITPSRSPAISRLEGTT